MFWKNILITLIFFTSLFYSVVSRLCWNYLRMVKSWCKSNSTTFDYKLNKSSVPPNCLKNNYLCCITCGMRIRIEWSNIKKSFQKFLFHSKAFQVLARKSSRLHKERMVNTNTLKLNTNTRKTKTITSMTKTNTLIMSTKTMIMSAKTAIVGTKVLAVSTKTLIMETKMIMNANISMIFKNMIIFTSIANLMIMS